MIVCTCESDYTSNCVYVGLFLSLSASGGGPTSVNVRNRNKAPNSFIHADRVGSRKSSKEKIGSIYLSSACLILLGGFSPLIEAGC